MKTRLVVSFIVVAFILGAWYFTRPASYLPGKVESQIHAFGMQLAPALAPNSTFHAVANGCQPQPEPPQAPAGLKPVEAQARTAMAQHHAGEAALVPTFPERYSAGTEVRGEGMVVKLMPLASNAAQAQIENGKLVYHNAYPSTDSLNVVTDGRSEEFLLLHDTAAPQRFEYDVSAISGVKSITLQDNSVHFTSADGKQMQIEAPWLIESGQPVAGAGPCASAFLPQVAVDRRATVQASPPKVHWELSFPNGPTQPRLALVVTNTSKLHYPVVIDPTWVVTNGSLNTARGYQTATLLNNGQVLVAGGYGEYNNALANAELYNPITGTWTATGSLKTARYIHTATLLANGQVLVMGGYGSLGASYGALASAELYNPGTGTWTATGSLVTARYSHTTTLLANGQALVAGGYCSSGLLGSAELYNPVTGTWTNTGSLITARDGHTATLLSNGQVLVNGGGGSLGTLPSAELYNPATGTWTVTGNLITARSSHTATLLANGQVLVAGGYDEGYLTSAELYNPTAGTWTSTGSIKNSRESHTATLLPNGQVLIVGGYNLGYLTSAELYNPTTGTWATTGNLNTGRTNHSATVLANGQVLVAGGFGGTGALTSGELYNATPVVGTFSATGSLNTGREEHQAILLPNGQVLVMGGLNGLTYLASVELYNPATGAWTSTGNLNVARQRFTATLLPNGQVLVAGGYGISGNYLASAELYDPTTGIWTVTGNLNNSRGDHTATLLLNGQVLVTGGDIPLYASCELYNPSTGTWTTTGSLNTSRMHHTATLLPNGRVLVAGGYNGNYPTTVELYNPTTGLWTVTGNLNIGRYSHTATLLPNGRVLFAGGTGYLNNLLTSSEVFDPVAGTSSTTGSLTNARYGHSATLLLNGQVLVAGGEGNAGTILASAEMYNPLTGIWTMMGSLNSPRYNHTANLLPTGQVLVSGGLGAGYLTSAELYNPGFGYTSATQPQLNAVSSVISASALSLTGTNFTGVSEASGGTTTNSASNIPVVQLQSLVNEQVINVPLDPSQGFSSTSFVSLPPIGLVPGYALLTMFVNGTPSLSQIVSYSSGVAPVITSSAPTSTATVGTPYNFTCTATGSPTPTFSVPPGALPTGLTLSSTGAISGTPTTPGLYTGTIQAGNGVSPVATQNFSITVNGTYAYWVSQYGLTGNQALPTAIVSPDGITNLMKYSQGLNPFTTYNPGSQSLPVVSFYESILGPSAENLFLTFTGTATDVTYNVQATSDLTGAWTTIKTFPSGGSSPPGTVTVEDTQAVGASPKRFMRLNVTIP